MDKNKKIKFPLICPVCGVGLLYKAKNYGNYTKTSIDCPYCGAIFDVESLSDYDKKNDIIFLSINDQIKEYEENIKSDPNYYSKAHYDDTNEPHMCPVCGEYKFPDFASFDICPICGWEDNGVDLDDENGGWGTNGKTIFQVKKEFEEKRKKDPKYRWDKTFRK